MRLFLIYHIIQEPPIAIKFKLILHYIHLDIQYFLLNLILFYMCIFAICINYYNKKITINFW